MLLLRNRDCLDPSHVAFKKIAAFFHRNVRLFDDDVSDLVLLAQDLIHQEVE